MCIRDRVIKSNTRIASDKYFSLVKDNAKRIKQKNEENAYSLNQIKFNKEVQANKKFAKEYEELEKTKSKLLLTNLKSTETLIAKDTVEKDKNKKWRESIEKDPYISEAVNVLSDWIALLPIELSKK